MVTQLPHISQAYTILSERYEDRPDVLVCGEGYLCYYHRDARRSPRPDCMVSFGLTTVTPADIMAARGYTISEVGKPPDFVLEVASESTGRRDYTVKRVIYASLKVVEYWRFDRTGGQFHDAALAGDRLTADGTYEPIPVYADADGIIRGYSAVLELELHWVDGWLRFWDPATGKYLPDLDEATDLAAAAAERAAAETERANAEAARANAEAHARQQAEARIRQLEAQLGRL